MGGEGVIRKVRGEEGGNKERGGGRRGVIRKVRGEGGEAHLADSPSCWRCVCEDTA